MQKTWEVDMAISNPYYRNNKEKEELIKKRDSFTFDEVEKLPKLVILIAGREGVGKTHLACTMSELGPVYLIDTEYRAQIVTRKFSNVKFAVTKSYKDMVIAVKHILHSHPPGTIILDSGSDLQTFSEIEYLERSEKEKVGMPWNWAEVWRLCNAVIDDIKFSQQFHLVITSRLKEEYNGDKPTGKQIPRIYSTLPYKSDIVLQFTESRDRTCNIIKNGFTGESSTSLTANKSLPQIIRELSSSDYSTAPQLINRIAQTTKPYNN